MATISMPKSGTDSERHRRRVPNNQCGTSMTIDVLVKTRIWIRTGRFGSSQTKES